MFYIDILKTRRTHSKISVFYIFSHSIIIRFLCNNVIGIFKFVYKTIYNA